MLRNISNLLPTIFYMLCGALVAMTYLELTYVNSIGCQQDSSNKYYPRATGQYQHCKCEEVLETIRFLQEKTLKVQRDLEHEKHKLKVLLQQLGGEPQQGNPNSFGGSRPWRPQDTSVFGSDVLERPYKDVQDNSKLPIWSFTPTFLFRPSSIVHNPRVPTDKSKDVGAKRTIKGAFRQICWHFKKKFGTRSCELIHGSLSIDLSLGLRLAFVIKLRRREPVFVKVDGLFKLEQRFSLKHANIIKNKDDIHIITMISDAVPISRLDSFLGMLKVLKRNREILYVYFSIYANRKNLERFRTRILDFSKNCESTFVRISHVNHKFERAYARHHGVSLLPAKDTLIIFVDIDITFDYGFLQRCQSYTQAGKGVYFPIVFSMYNPVFYPKGGNKTFVVSRRKGFWRTTGLGNLCVYKSDYLAVGGFNTNITGWGSEDDDLYERWVVSLIISQVFS